jgi:hypothetical protein
MVNTRSI